MEVNLLESFLILLAALVFGRVVRSIITRIELRNCRTADEDCCEDTKECCEDDGDCCGNPEGCSEDSGSEQG